MRSLIEIILVAALIALAWEKSLKERVNQLPWLTQDHPRSSTLNPRPAPTASPNGAWMWDSNRQGILDTPRPNTAKTSPGPSSTAASWMFDPNHRSSLDPPAKKHPGPTPH